MFEDLREYTEWLESSNKLHKVNKKVSSDCEITEIVTRMIKKNGPTLLFENVDNNNIPVVANLFGSEEKVCDALGHSDIKMTTKYTHNDTLELVQAFPDVAKRHNREQNGHQMMDTTALSSLQTDSQSDNFTRVNAGVV